MILRRECSERTLSTRPPTESSNSLSGIDQVRKQGVWYCANENSCLGVPNSIQTSRNSCHGSPLACVSPSSRPPDSLTRNTASRFLSSLSTSQVSRSCTMQSSFAHVRRTLPLRTFPPCLTSHSCRIAGYCMTVTKPSERADLIADLAHHDTADVSTHKTLDPDRPGSVATVQGPRSDLRHCNRTQV